ncbi:MAG: hypothetical protein H5T62_12330 [Anaerolineae bacterium]|nr:hypothetical protein [Anaerolineae bacterium]
MRKMEGGLDAVYFLAKETPPADGNGVLKQKAELQKIEIFRQLGCVSAMALEQPQRCGPMFAWVAVILNYL